MSRYPLPPEADTPEEARAYYDAVDEYEDARAMERRDAGGES